MPKTTKPATKPARKPVAKKPAAKKPAARRVPARKPVADFAPVAKAAKSYVEGIIAHDKENAKSSETMGKALAALFPKREKRFGLRADGKSYRANNANAPLAFIALWSAVYDGCATRHPDGKIQWINTAQKGHRSNVWTAVLAYVRGDIKTFSWNLSRQRADEKKESARKANGGKLPKRVKDPAHVSIAKRLESIKGEIDDKLASMADVNVANARMRITQAIEALAKIQ